MLADGGPRRFVPTVPPAQQDELPSSWLGRLLGVYRLYLQDVNHFLRSCPDVGRVDFLTLRALDVAPPDRVLRAASALAAANPDEIGALSLAARYPHCPLHWFSTDPVQPVPGPWTPPGLCCANYGAIAACCPDCLRDDRGVGRVAYIRAGWAVITETICPLHRCSLRKRCPGCGWVCKDYAFPHAAGVWRPCCDACGLSCDAVPGDTMPTSPALGVEFLLSFEASLGAAIRGRHVHRRWIGSRCGVALLRLVSDLGWAFMRTVDGAEDLAIERLQAPQFPFCGRTEEKGECADAQLAHLPVESRRAVFAAIAAMLRPNLTRQIWPDARAFQGDPLRDLLACLQPEDHSALLSRAQGWPHSVRARVAPVERTTPRSGQRTETENGRSVVSMRRRKHGYQGQLMV